MLERPPTDDDQRPVPLTWRPAIRAICAALAQGDYRVSGEVPGVAPVSEQTAEHVRENVQDYGATLAELPEASWDSSICVWQGGHHWVALIDLWTLEEGRSDLVLHLRAEDLEKGIVLSVYMVYVP